MQRLDKVDGADLVPRRESLVPNRVKPDPSRLDEKAVVGLVDGEKDFKAAIGVDADDVVVGVFVDASGVNLRKVARADLDAGAVGKIGGVSSEPRAARRGERVARVGHEARVEVAQLALSVRARGRVRRPGDPVAVDVRVARGPALRGGHARRHGRAVGEEWIGRGSAVALSAIHAIIVHVGGAHKQPVADDNVRVGVAVKVAHGRHLGLVHRRADDATVAKGRRGGGAVVIPRLRPHATHGFVPAVRDAAVARAGRTERGHPAVGAAVGPRVGSGGVGGRVEAARRPAAVAGRKHVEAGAAVVGGAGARTIAHVRRVRARADAAARDHLCTGLALPRKAHIGRVVARRVLRRRAVGELLLLALQRAGRRVARVPRRNRRREHVKVAVARRGVGNQVRSKLHDGVVERVGGVKVGSVKPVDALRNGIAPAPLLGEAATARLALLAFPQAAAAAHVRACANLAFELGAANAPRGSGDEFVLRPALAGEPVVALGHAGNAGVVVSFATERGSAVGLAARGRLKVARFLRFARFVGQAFGKAAVFQLLGVGLSGFAGRASQPKVVLSSAALVVCDAWLEAAWKGRAGGLLHLIERRGQIAQLLRGHKLCVKSACAGVRSQRTEWRIGERARVRAERVVHAVSRIVQSRHAFVFRERRVCQNGS